MAWHTDLFSFFCVRTERSTSGTWSSTPQQWSRMGRISFSTLENSLSAWISTIRKPRALYFCRTMFISWRIEALDLLKFYKPENPRNNTKLKITRQKYDRVKRWRPKILGTRILIGTSFIPNPFPKFPIIYGSIFHLFRVHLWSFYHLRKYLTISSEFIFEVFYSMWKSHESLLSFIPNSFREDLLT